jgi:hypothetical protein
VKLIGMWLKKKSLPKILEKEHKAFDILWHNYHAKHRIPYAHDEADDFFTKLTLIFLEDRDENKRKAN